MNPELASALEQLRDIHAAPPAPWWPPAPGWWLLAALVAVLLALAARRAWRALQARQRRRRWLRALDAAVLLHDPESNPGEFLALINRLFKRVALNAFPGQGTARLAGREWTEFLRRQFAELGIEVDVGVLADGPYRPAPGFDAAALTQAARTWIRRYG